jgi:hypothetical protein
MPEPDLSAEAAKVIERTLAADHQFWRDLITDEVERLRFNQGLEPIRALLYEIKGSSKGPHFMGLTRIGHSTFNITGTWTTDSLGKECLRVVVLKAPSI